MDSPKAVPQFSRESYMRKPMARRLDYPRRLACPVTIFVTTIRSYREVCSNTGESGPKSGCS